MRNLIKADAVLPCVAPATEDEVADSTRICWTQLLREDADGVGAPLERTALPPLTKEEIDRLFPLDD